MSLLSDNGLEALLDVIEVVEKNGCMPSSFYNYLLLLLQATGGHRLIGNLPSLFRVWGYLRREQIHQWQLGHDRDYAWSSKGHNAIQEV